MAVVVQVTLRGVTPKQYDAVRAEAGWIEQPPAGGLSHLTWWEGDVCHNVDAWESEAAFQAFADNRLGPALGSVGITAQPEVTMHPAHEVFTPRAGVIAPTAAPALVATDNVALLRRGYEAFATGDIGGVLALFAPSIVWTTPDTIRFGGRFVGPAAVGEFFATLPDNYAELRVEPATFVDRGDTVVALGRHVGRSATGVAFDIPWVHVWTFADGKASSFTEYFDTVRMNAALGLVPQGVEQRERQHA
jgi:ketosteroid isomerase-like protein